MIAYQLPPDLVEVPFSDGSGVWYTHGGDWIRSISKILGRIYPMPPGLDPYYLERGRMVHHATTLIDAGTLAWGEFDDRLKPFCYAYADFVSTVRPVIEASELTVVHPSYRYGARLDRVMRFHEQDRLMVVDLKCGTGKEDRYWLQVAGCAIALDKGNVQDYDLALLNLDSKGNPHFTVADNPAEWLNRWRKVLEEDVK